MANNQLLQAISSLMDEKFEKSEKRLKSELLSEILPRLSALEDRVSALEDRVSALEDRVSALETNLSILMSKVSALETKVNNIWLVIENEIRPNISILAENFPDLQQIKVNAEDIVQLETNVETLNIVVSDHSDKIHILENKVS